MQTARAQAGVISHGQLEAYGVSPATITRLLRRGGLTKLERSVYLGGAAPFTHEAGLCSAVLGTGGTLGFDTCAICGGSSRSPGRGST